MCHRIFTLVLWALWRWPPATHDSLPWAGTGWHAAIAKAYAAKTACVARLGSWSFSYAAIHAREADGMPLAAAIRDVAGLAARNGGA